MKLFPRVAAVFTRNTMFIAVGTMSSEETTSTIERLAVYIANLFFLTSDTSAPVLKDKDLTDEVAGELIICYMKISFECF